ncbi:hypothetical protein OAA06_01055 [bacterium]|nr:hypothetical protein [bacterium]
MRLKMIKGLMLSLLFFCISCDKDDEFDESKFIKLDDVQQKDGSCKVSITGVSENGYEFNEDFALDYRVEPNVYFEDDDVIIFLIYQFSEVASSRNYMNFELRYDKNTKEVGLSHYYLNYSKMIDSKSMVNVSESNYRNDESVVSNFVFVDDSSIAGNFTTSKTQVYYNDDGEHIEGIMTISVEFNVNVVKVVNGNPDDY